MSIDTPAEGGFQAPLPAPSAPLAAVPTPPSTPGAPQLIRAPRIERWVPVPEYGDYQMRVWINVSKRAADDITSGDQERALPALRQIVLEHNGWADVDGEPYPAADDPSFWDKLPVHLVAAIARGIQEGATASPLPARNGAK